MRAWGMGERGIATSHAEDQGLPGHRVVVVAVERSSWVRAKGQAEAHQAVVREGEHAAAARRGAAARGHQDVDGREAQGGKMWKV